MFFKKPTQIFFKKNNRTSLKEASALTLLFFYSNVSLASDQIAFKTSTNCNYAGLESYYFSTPSQASVGSTTIFVSESYIPNSDLVIKLTENLNEADVVFSSSHGKRQICNSYNSLVGITHINISNSSFRGYYSVVVSPLVNNYDLALYMDSNAFSVEEAAALIGYKLSRKWN